MRTLSNSEQLDFPPEIETIPNRPLRILHILNDVRELGNGIINTTMDIAWGQAQLGHIVAVASGGGEYEKLLENSGIKHFNLNQKRTPISLFSAVFNLQKIIKEFRPDIVHCHMMTGIVLGKLLHGLGNYRLVSHIHNVHQGSSILMGLAERVIPVSEAVANYMSKKGISKDKMQVVKNLTLGSPRLPSLDLSIPANLAQPAIVTVAGMSQRKGIAELISAFELIADRFPQTHLYLVGDGPDRVTFERQAEASPFCDRIHFEGFQKNPQAYMQSAHIFVLASRRESFGIALLEARQTGCAIVASNIDGIPEALDDGKAGILVPPGDVKALAQAMENLLANPLEHEKWQRAARQNLEHFTVNNMVKEITAIYYQLFA
ncbi:MAG TPA: glycosyltransferase [Leptolyngbyaceae cyanobacterium]